MSLKTCGATKEQLNNKLSYTVASCWSLLEESCVPAESPMMIPHLFSSLPSHYTKYALLAPTQQWTDVKWMASYGPEKAACCLYMRLDWTIGSSVTWMDIFLFFCLEDGGSRFLWNPITFTPYFVMSHPRRQPSSQSPTDNLKSHITYLLYCLCVNVLPPGDNLIAVNK
jgi:hypothetical protein